MEKIFKGFAAVANKYNKKILISTHPRTAEKLNQFGINPENQNIKLLKPLGFFEFVKLEKNALGVLTDSGTVQEECSIFGIPNVTLRDVTERPETVECGSNILSGADPEMILRAVDIAISQPATWIPPKEYTVENVSQTVCKIVLGYSSVKKHVS